MNKERTCLYELKEKDNKGFENLNLNEKDWTRAFQSLVEYLKGCPSDTKITWNMCFLMNCWSTCCLLHQAGRSDWQPGLIEQKSWRYCHSEHVGESGPMVIRPTQNTYGGSAGSHGSS